MASNACNPIFWQLLWKIGIKKNENQNLVWIEDSEIYSIKPLPLILMEKQWHNQKNDKNCYCHLITRTTLWPVFVVQVALHWTKECYYGTLFKLQLTYHIKWENIMSWQC